MNTKTIKFIRKAMIPRREKAVYTRLVADLRPNKEVHERLRMCMGGDQMESVMDTATRTADLTTCKVHLNGVVSTEGGRFVASDVKDFYLETSIKKPRYGKVRAKYIPQAIINKYGLQDMIEDGWLYFEINKGMYGIPEAGKFGK